MKGVTMNEMFEKDNLRAEKFNIEWNDFFVDYSKNIINQETINLLLELANECQLKEAISDYFEGKNINETENRAVLHTALRASNDCDIKVNGKNIIPDIIEVKSNIKAFTNEVIVGNRKGFTR